MKPFTVVHNLTESKIDDYWEKLHPQGSFFGKLEGQNRAEFGRVLRNSVMVLEFPFGYARVEYDTWKKKTWIHAAFWHRAVFGGEDRLKAGAHYVAETIGTPELCVAIPTTTRGLARIVENVGFQWRGTIKGFYHTPEGCFDANLYTMIVEIGGEDGR